MNFIYENKILLIIIKIYLVVRSVTVFFVTCWIIGTNFPFLKEMYFVMVLGVMYWKNGLV